LEQRFARFGIRFLLQLIDRLYNAAIVAEFPPQGSLEPLVSVYYSALHDFACARGNASTQSGHYGGEGDEFQLGLLSRSSSYISFPLEKICCKFDHSRSPLRLAGLVAGAVDIRHSYLE